MKLRSAPSQPPALSFGVAEQESSRAAVNVAPLVDIVLLLISFYLLVATSIQSYPDHSIRLPVMENPQLRSQQPAELVINVPQQGELSVNSEAVSIEALPELIRSRQSSVQQDDQPIRAVIRADGRQPYGRLDRVLTICREAGLPRVLLRVREDPR